MLASLDLWLLLKEPLAGEPQADVLRGFGLMGVQNLAKHGKATKKKREMLRKYKTFKWRLK